jgi:hypothetical protein
MSTEALRELLDALTTPFPPETAGHEAQLAWGDRNTAAIASARAALAAAPAGGAEPVAYLLLDQGCRAPDDCEDFERVVLPSEITPEELKRFQDAGRCSPLYAAPTAQPQPQPEPVVLFDDRPQNQRIAEAEERMRNPAPLQWEDGDPDATPEQMRYVSALDPAMQAINTPAITVYELAQELGVKASAVLVACLRYGQQPTLNQAIDGGLANLVRRDCKTAQPEAPAEPVCPACNGEGSVQAMTSHLGPDDYEYDESCIACNGTGSPDLKDALEGVGFIRHPQFPARTYISREAVMKIVEARAALATPAPVAPIEQDITRILLDVVPGEDGMGHEVYATCVKDVEAVLTRLGDRIEELESRPAAPAAQQPAERSTELLLRDALSEVWREMHDLAEKRTSRYKDSDLDSPGSYITANINHAVLAAKNCLRIIDAAIKAQGGSHAA